MRRFRFNRRFQDRVVVVAATGPSLSKQDLEHARSHGAALVAVNDAYRLAPWSDVLYACDPEWWDHHAGAEQFAGERWTQDEGAARRWRLNYIEGRRRPGFCLTGEAVHYGDNSGYQAINLALYMGARRVVLLGFDMQATGGRRHYFGNHPGAMNKEHPYRIWLAAFDEAARLHPTLDIINATRDTALIAWPRMTIEEALA